MKLMVAPYNNGASTWSEAEETAFRSYSIDHQFNKPARANIILADPTGAILRKYNTDANDVYIGVGKITIEDPTGVDDVFYGRILRAVGDSSARTVTLECEDIMGQLADEEITYDMREKLKGDLRQSTAYADKSLDTKRYLIDAAVHTLYSAQADDGGAFTDETDEANDLTTNDMTLLPDVPVVNDAYYFGFESKAGGMTLNISTQGLWDGTITWEYWDGGAWSGLGIHSPTDAKWYFEDSGELSFEWTVPGDWATVAVNGVTAYYVRARVATYIILTTVPKGKICWAEFYFYDDAMAWANDAYNGLNLVLTAGMAGTRTWKFHPYSGDDEGSATVYNDNFERVWLDDNTVDGGTHNNDWYILYKFKAHVGNNTASDLYIDDSITKATITIRYNVTFTNDGMTI